MAYENFPQKVYAKLPPMAGALPDKFYLSIEDALHQIRGTRWVAEYTLNQAVEAELVAKVKEPS